MGRQAGGAHFLDDAHAPVDFHGARVAALHLRQLGGRRFLLDEGRAHAAPAEFERQREPDRTGTDDKHLGIQAPRPPSPPAKRGLYRVLRFANIRSPPGCRLRTFPWPTSTSCWKNS